MKVSYVFKVLTASLLMAAATVGSLYAVPVLPGPKKIVQADGTTITVLNYGDERFNYATTIDGYNIVNEKGVYYYAQAVGNKLVSLGVPAKDPVDRTAEDRAALDRATSGLPVGVAMYAQQMACSGGGLSFGASPRNMEALAAAGSDISSGEPFYSLVILVDFPDQGFTIDNPREAFSNLLNQDGYSSNGATGSARDYYVDNSNGKFNPHFDVVGPYTVSESVFYYGQDANDSRLRNFVIEACELAEAAGVDFSKYVNADGNLKDVFIFYAGYNNAEAAGGYIHPARIFYPDGSWDFGSYGGARLMAAAYTSELKGSSGATMTGIGTFCHEYGHILGWPDMYDTDYSANGTGFNLDIFSLMASGSYVNGGNTPPAISAMERYMVGWAEPEVINAAGEYTLEPVYDDKFFVINTTNDGEYFIFEYRNAANSRWDAFLRDGNTTEGTGYPAYGSGSGMMVYHVDQSNNTIAAGLTAKDLWGLNANMVNAYGNHECMRIKMAQNIQRGSNGILQDFGKAFFPGTGGVTKFTAADAPNFTGWNGYSTGWELVNIAENGTENVTFEVKKLDSGSVQNVSVEAYQYDIVVTFVSPFDDDYTVKCTENGGETLSQTSDMQAFHFSGLKPDTKYTVTISLAGSDEALHTQEVTTQAVVATRVPSLNIEYSHNKGDNLVLTYSNIQTTVSSVQWYMDEQKVDGTVVTLNSTGDHKITAEINTSEGVVYLVKYINVRG